MNDFLSQLPFLHRLLILRINSVELLFGDAADFAEAFDGRLYPFACLVMSVLDQVQILFAFWASFHQKHGSLRAI